MARTTGNIDLVPREVMEHLKQLDTQLGQTTENLKGLLTEANEVSNALARSTVEYKDLKELLKALDAIGKKVNDTGKKRRDIIMQIADKQEKLKEADSKEAVELQKVNEQLRRQNNLNKSVAKSNIANANSIDAMRERLKRWTAIANSMDTNTPQFQKMSEAVGKLQGEILKYESAMGNYRRNVGNYASGFNMLQYNIQQVARELPSLTISASQFFLAISNNLPMLVDELNRAREANAALRKEGQATIPVWRQLLKGIMSWQTVLIVAITLLTAFSKEIIGWVKGLFQGEEALDAVTEAQKRLNEAQREGAKNAQEELLRLRLLRETAEDTTKSSEERTRAVEELQRLYPDYLGNLDEEKILSGDVAGAYRQLSTDILNAAKSKAIFDKAVESSREALELENTYRDLVKESPLFNMFPEDDGKFMEEVRKQYERERVQLEQAQNEAAAMFGRTSTFIPPQTATILGQIISAYDKWQNKALETEELIKRINLQAMDRFTNLGGGGDVDDELSNERDVRLQYYELVYKDYAEKNKAMVMDDKLSYEDRMEALKKFTDAQITAINMAKQAQLDALAEDEDTTFQRLIIERKAQGEIEKIARESAEIQIEIERDRVQKIIEEINKVQAARTQEYSVNESKELSMLAKQFADGLIQREDYEKRKNEMSRKYEEENFRTEMEYLNKVLNLSGLSEEDKVKYTEQLEKAEMDYRKWLYDQDVKNYEEAAKTKEDIERESSRIKQELVQSAFDFVNALYQRETESNMNRLDKESEENQEWADEEAARIDRLEESGAISKEQAEARKAAIEDQAQAREDEIEQKRREVQKKQAQFEKALALMQIALSTANAIHKIQAEAAAAAAIPFVGAALAAAALAQIPVVLASGAVQAAVVAATPIPEYAEGTEDHPGGLAIVGDGGRSEMIIAGGKVYKTPSVDTLVDLPKHAMVLPDFNAGVEKLPEMPRFEATSTVNVDLSKLEESSIENGKLLRLVLNRMEINAKNEIYARELSRLRPTKL